MLSGESPRAFGCGASAHGKMDWGMTTMKKRPRIIIRKSLRQIKALLKRHDRDLERVKAMTENPEDWRITNIKGRKEATLQYVHNITKPRAEVL